MISSEFCFLDRLPFLPSLFYFSFPLKKDQRLGRSFFDPDFNFVFQRVVCFFEFYFWPYQAIPSSFQPKMLNWFCSAIDEV